MLARGAESHSSQTLALMACIGVKGLRTTAPAVYWRVDVFMINGDGNPQHYRWHIYHDARTWPWPA